MPGQLLGGPDKIGLNSPYRAKFPESCDEPLKSVVCRDDRDRQGTLCGPCWLPIRELVWIVPGPFAAWGRCRSCSGWFSVRELADRKPGGGHGAMIGLCAGCALPGQGV